MKSFTTVTLVAAAAALASAQITTNTTTGVITCAIPNGAYCVDGSLGSNIIIRCNNGIGQPGNCDDNLSGYFPFGVNYAPCYETSPTAGDAACSKNCVIVGGSGGTVPNCTPEVQSSSSTTLVTSTTPPLSTGVTSSSTTTSTGTTTFVNGSTTVTKTFTTTFCPTSTAVALGTGSGAPIPSGNGTLPTTSGSGSGGSATATPVGPTTTSGGSPPFVTANAAITNTAGSALAVVGIFAALFF